MKDHFIYHRTNTHNINNNWMAGYTTDKNRLLLSMDNEHMQS